MSRKQISFTPILLTAAAIFLGPMPAQAFVASDAPRADLPILSVKRAKCAAGTVEDYEGTDMSGVTPSCESIFNACVDEKLPCKLRLEKCRQFDKMDRDGSCYKRKK